MPKNYVLNLGIIEALQNFVGSDNSNIKRLVCWIIDNVTAESKNIELVFNNNLINPLMII